VIDPQTGYRRVFIRATIADNPYLHNTEYERSLAALPEASRKALLEGRWDVFEGAVFSEWDPNIHTCEPFPIPAEWQIWRGCDDGFAAPCACLWLAHDETHDRIFVVQELYERGLTPEVMARAVLAIDRSIPLDDGGEIFDNDMPLDGVIDSAAFSEIGLGAESGKGSRGDIMNSLRVQLETRPQGRWLAGARAVGHPPAAGAKEGRLRRACDIPGLPQFDSHVASYGLFPHEPGGHRRFLRATRGGMLCGTA
jgi:hypothetical protein